MSRNTRYVTRSMKSTKCEILCVDAAGEKVEKKQFNLPGLFKNNEAILKYVSRIAPEANAVRVMSAEPVVELRGQTEEFFLANSISMVNAYTPAEK